MPSGDMTSDMLSAWQQADKNVFEMSKQEDKMRPHWFYA
jgi:hypothetical protein